VTVGGTAAVIFGDSSVFRVGVLGVERHHARGLWFSGQISLGTEGEAESPVDGDRICWQGD
jgi:hypothetical protein